MKYSVFARIFFPLLVGSLALCFDWSSAACQTNEVELSGRCFVFFPDSAFDFVESRSLCQSLGGDLPIVDDCNLLSDIQQYNNVIGKSGYWVGASDGFNEGDWQWINGTSVKMGAPFWSQYNQTGVPAPNITGVNNRCLSMNTLNSFYFTDEVCTEVERIPLCQHSPTNCPPPYVFVGEMCLQFLSSVLLTWPEARAVCQSSGGDLAIVDDCNMMTQIIDYIIAFAVPVAEGIWIGGSTLDEADVWKWIDVTPVAMGAPFWAVGRQGAGLLQPDNAGGIENCGFIYANGHLNDYTCSRVLENQGVMCEMP